MNSNFGLPEEDEYWRLRALENVYDPPTIQILDQLGVAPGWRCVEVGAGAGSIAVVLQQRSGSVIVVEPDGRYISHLASPSFTLVETTIEEAEFPRDRDLIHARFLLDIVKEPRAVLEKLVSCLRPGYWLFLEEFDDLTLEPVCKGSERARELHDAIVQAKQESWRTEGHDNHFGRQLPDLFVELGLEEVDNSCGCRLRQSATPGRFAWRQTVLGMTESLKRQGLSSNDVTEYVAVLDDPGFSYFSPLVVRAWGRAPW